mmetsp:Transcript_1738/g.2937  ORF Transcript_1738/g.2937 Transcript_1738/m.2937 type:complete len:80 (-) Transcript_1738:445-684(-)
MMVEIDSALRNTVPSASKVVNGDSLKYSNAYSFNGQLQLGTLKVSSSPSKKLSAKTHSSNATVTNLGVLFMNNLAVRYA